MQWLRTSDCISFLGICLSWSNAINIGEQAEHAQVWPSGLLKPNSPFPNISYKVPFNQECSFPAFNTF